MSITSSDFLRDIRRIAVRKRVRFSAIEDLERARHHLDYGMDEAVFVVGQAVGFGNRVAESWLGDARHSLWLTFNNMYAPDGGYYR